MKKKILSIFIMLFLTTMIIPTIKSSEYETTTRDWTIIETFSIPEDASGLAYDGTTIYCGIYGSNGDEIYQIDPSDGSYSLLCNGPQDDAYGLTYDGTYLWTTHHPSDPATALQIDMSGNLISQFNLPDEYMSGIAYDNDDFWVATYYNPDGYIYKVNETGSILQSFSAPDNQPWDLEFDGTSLWMVDKWGDMIYEINPSDGSVLNNYDSVGSDPTGIMWDGNYLWYCDDGQGGVDYLYKVDLAGSGTPEINVPITSHHYGIVTVGTQESWDVTVESIGTGDLVINDVTFSGTGSQYMSCSSTFPVTIPSGSNDQLPLIYEPLTPGVLDATAIIHSNDPVDPEIDISVTGNAVSSGPDIYLPDDTNDYGNVRVDSYNRWIMTIENRGDSTLTINDITSSDSRFIVDPDVSFPFSLSSLSTKEIDIWFKPTSDIYYSTNIEIDSNDPDENPYLVNVQGTGIIVPTGIGALLWDYTITDPYDSSPKAITSIPDINYDGIPEVIVCSEDDYIRCFNGNDHGLGDVLWEKEIYSGSLYHQQEIKITEDIDNDGFDDIVLGTPWGDKSIYTISGKTGETIWKHDTDEYGLGGWVYMVDNSYDYNNDGIVDVLAATGDDQDDNGPKRVYCLDALTGDSIWERPLGGPVFSVIGVEDFTGDGTPDVIAGASNDPETQGYAYGINGVNGIVEWTVTTPGSSVWALGQIDDINNDNVKDVVIGDFLDIGNIYGLDATNGNELFSNSLYTSMILRFEIIDDVNNDGYKDILPAHTGSTARVIDGYTGDFIWSQGLADKSWCIAKSNDISGDDINDVFIGTLYSNNYCYFLNGQNGSILESIAMEAAVDAIASIPDIIGDNSMEMVAGLRDGQVICLSGGKKSSQGVQDIKISNVKQDWNLVSIPFNEAISKNNVTVNYADINYTWSDAVTNGYINDYIFGWNRIGQSYTMPSTFDPGEGYWLYANVDCELWIDNITIVPDEDVTSLKQDWNLIGIPSLQSIDKTNLIVNHGGSDYSWVDAVTNGFINDYIFGWNRIGQSYTMPSTFDPGEGYWLYANVDCTLKKPIVS